MPDSLNSYEARVLGVLVEKAFTTPDQYPLTLNALLNGCNQKSNRSPLTDYVSAEVTVALGGLRFKHHGKQFGRSTRTGTPDPHRSRHVRAVPVDHRPEVTDHQIAFDQRPTTGARMG